LQRLRQTHPGMVIDGNFNAVAAHEGSQIPSDTRDRVQTSWLPQAIGAWEKAGRPKIPAPQPAK
jgi:hypothetical protein